MKITFWGATRQVTGSMFLLESEDGYRLLVDCGMDMERKRKDAAPPSNGVYVPLFPFEASTIHTVLLTHAHLDHSGNLPNLIREGFEGRIYCTAPTASLSEILLYDSASINKSKLLSKQAAKTGKKNRRGFYPREENNGLYLEQHVEEAVGAFTSVPFGQSIKLSDGLSFTFYKAGHLLGAAHIIVKFKKAGQTFSLGFSGDIGRQHYPLLQDPEPLPPVDFLVMESTYGNRQHYLPNNPEAQLEQIIKETCVDKPGRLIIPAFSVGRTQALLFTLKKLYSKGRLPRIKVFSDSPMALSSTKVYERYLSWLNSEARQFHDEEEHLFDFESLEYVHDSKRSKALSDHHEPCIIISASGMMTGGRVEHHIRQNLQNPYATIFIIGYCAEGTLGHSLLQGKNHIYDREEKIMIQAEVRHTDVFSGHGDINDLLKFVQRHSPEKLSKIFLTHGDEQSMLSFADTLQEIGYNGVKAPEKGETVEL